MIRVTALLIAAVVISIGLLTALPAAATPFTFNTGAVTNLMATAARPDIGGKFEIESADDFVTTGPTSITRATFTGLLTGGATVGNIGGGRRRNLSGLSGRFEYSPDQFPCSSLFDKPGARTTEFAIGCGIGLP
jgi:hypothetical protein